MIVKVKTENCNACEVCLEVCPMGCIELRGGAAFVVGSSCRGCQVCQSVCPSAAIVEDPAEAGHQRSSLGKGGRPW